MSFSPQMFPGNLANMLVLSVAVLAIEKEQDGNVTKMYSIDEQ